MKKYVIEYSFGENDKVKQIVESDSDNMGVILIAKTNKDRISFTDERGHYYNFEFSAVKYFKVYPYVEREVMGRESM